MFFFFWFFLCIVVIVKCVSKTTQFLSCWEDYGIFGFWICRDFWLCFKQTLLLFFFFSLSHFLIMDARFCYLSFIFFFLLLIKIKSDQSSTYIIIFIFFLFFKACLCHLQFKTFSLLSLVCEFFSIFFCSLLITAMIMKKRNLESVSKLSSVSKRLNRSKTGIESLKKDQEMVGFLLWWWLVIL